MHLAKFKGSKLLEQISWQQWDQASIETGRSGIVLVSIDYSFILTF